MSDAYFTISEPGEGKVTEKMSRFLSFAAHAATAEDARAFVAEITRRYHDARHVCWAYRLGYDGEATMSNDNGEPSGTAGKPILGQMVSKDVTFAVVAVVRYFGGIKLGTSGLIVAYRAAAREALDAAVIVERHAMETLEVTFPYMAMNGVMRLAKGDGIEFVNQEFDNTCKLVLAVRRDNVAKLREGLEDLDGVTVR